MIEPGLGYSQIQMTDLESVKSNWFKIKQLKVKIDYDQKRFWSNEVISLPF